MKTFKQYFNEAFHPHNTNPFDNLSDKTLIFFDTETTGFSPKKDQVTELAAIAVDGATLEKKDTYHEYIVLYKANPDPKILAMTHYDASKATKDEITVLKEFVNFVFSHHNPIIVAHNATFDMSMIMDKIGRTLSGVKVYDTLAFARFLFAPTLTVMADQGNKTAEKMLNAITKVTKTGKMVVTKNNNRMITSTLGALGKAIETDISNWHNALADTETLVQIFKKMKEYYNADILNDPTFMKSLVHAHKQQRLQKKLPV